MPHEPLAIWTIFDHPGDYPMAFVARRFDCAEPTDEVIVAITLDELRSIMKSKGLIKILRAPDDQSNIIESWF